MVGSGVRHPTLNQGVFRKTCSSWETTSEIDRV
jgi:hypothetical protein